MTFITDGNLWKTWPMELTLKLFVTKALFTFILLTIYQGLLRHGKALSQLAFTCYIFLKWFCFFFSHTALQLIIAAHSSISTLKALRFLWVLLSLTGIIWVFFFFFFFHFVSDPLSYTARRGASSATERMKRLLELIFICGAVPMAFLGVWCAIIRFWLCNWNAKSLKAQLYWPYQQFALFPKALLEQIHDHFWFKITICFKKKNLIDDVERNWCLSLYCISMPILFSFFFLLKSLFEYG